MKWIKKWWLLILVILAIAGVGWLEKRCHTQEYRCRAIYAAELPAPLSVDQQVSSQQAIAAACEPNGYLCRLFSAANLPSILLVIVGMAGIWAALRTLKTIQTQVGQVEREFIASHRPKLVIREVQMLDRKKDGDAVVIEYVIANAGDGKAQIVESFTEATPVDFGIIGPMRRDISFINDVGNSSVQALFEIEPGEIIGISYTCNFNYDRVFPRTNGIIDPDSSEIQLVFRGRLIYRDGNGTKRQTTFCRSYDFKTRRFRRINDPDLEYED